MKKKKFGEYIFFYFSLFFQLLGIRKKIIIMKKKILGIIVFGLLPNYIEFFFFIAIQFLYCREKEN